MTDRPLLAVREAVTLVGGGPVAAHHLRAALGIAPIAVGCDGGGDVSLPDGVQYRAVIGDMDSLLGSARLAAAGVPLHRIAEQDSTDLEKCLRSISAPLVIGLGFLGGRIDHHLAAMNALVRHSGQAVVLVGGEDLCFLAPPVMGLPVPSGTRVSFFPMGPVRGTLSEGLRWPVAGLDFAPDGRIGTSNETNAPNVRFGFDAPRMLAILPAEMLGIVAEMLPAAA